MAIDVNAGSGSNLQVYCTLAREAGVTKKLWFIEEHRGAAALSFIFPYSPDRFPLLVVLQFCFRLPFGLPSIHRVDLL